MELLKSAVSKARPRATDDYFEAVIVAKKVTKEAKKQSAEIAHTARAMASQVC